MILLDSSLWIDLLIDPSRFPSGAGRITEFVTCGPILQEVLQGLDPYKAGSHTLKSAMLALPRLSDPVPAELYLEAADIFQEGRLKGFTIRSGFDCLIAAVAIRNNIELWHRDRDFLMIARYTKLRAVPQYSH